MAEALFWSCRSFQGFDKIQYCVFVRIVMQRTEDIDLEARKFAQQYSGDPD